MRYAVIFSACEENDRLTVELKAIDAGDKETMAAVLIGPAFLTGFSHDQRAMLRNRRAEKIAGDPIARKRLIEKARQPISGNSTNCCQHSKRSFRATALRRLRKNAGDEIGTRRLYPAH
ncbi:hypothetical protein NKJ59_07580 [Mesorhizobium australicum]|uniref:hypothetical protein n=1 Tax=Mesorhizobium australicum TaxID=536018 RepID=UPI00333BDE39